MYDQLKESYRRNTQFDFEWPVLSRIKNLQQVKSLAEQFQKALQAWQNDLPQYLQEETTRLSSKTVQQKLVTSTLPLNLEEKMDALLHELNDSELLAEPVVHQLLTLQKRQKFLEQTQTNLEHLLRNMRDFEAFYPWQQFWLSLNEPEQKVIQALATIKTSNWEIAFKSWFLHQALQQVHDPALPDDKLPLGEYRENWEQLRKMMSLHIRHLWQERHTQLLKRIKKDKNWGSRVSSKSGYFPEGALYQEAAPWLTERFPIWMSTPSNALGVFGHQTDRPFDWLIVNNLAEISKVEILQLAGLAKHVVLVGDGEEHLSLADTLLDDVLPTPLETHYLKGIHHYYPANVQQIFYGHYFTESALAKSFKWVHHVSNSRYKADKLTNSAEVEAVLNWVLDLEAAAKTGLPSIAIVTTTVAQRDAIVAALLQLRRTPTSTSTFIQQLERSGFGVYHLGELTGLTADTLLFSATFGPDEEGKLDSSIEALNHPIQIQQLLQLMQIAQKEGHMFHSLPAEVLADLAQNQKNQGPFLLCNYILLAEAWQKGDIASQEAIAERLLEWREAVPLENPAPIFWQELGLMLRPYLAPERIVRHPQESPIHLPLMIRPLLEGGHPIALIADGFFASTPFTDFNWEQSQRRWFNQNNWKCLPIWSVNFWKNPDQEGRKTAGQIIRLEKNGQ